MSTASNSMTSVNSEIAPESSTQHQAAGPSTLANNKRSLSTSSSSSTEFIKMEEFTEELNAMIGADVDVEVNRSDKIVTVGQRLMSIAASTARFFAGVAPTTNPLGGSVVKPLPNVSAGHVSASGIDYVKISADSKLGVFQATVKQLEKYSAEFVKNRRAVIIHTFSASNQSNDQCIAYYAALFSTIGNVVAVMTECPIGTAVESLTVTAGASEMVDEHTIEAQTPILDDFAGSLALKVVETIGGSALQYYNFVLIRMRFTNTGAAAQFRNIFNGPALKSVLARFILNSRLPYCHFPATAPERRLRAAMLAQCARHNEAAARFAAEHGFAEPTSVKHVTNGTYIFKKIESLYGPIGSAKIPIDAQSSLGQMRGSIFTLVKYAQTCLTKRSNLVIRHVPESLNLSAINTLLRQALDDKCEAQSQPQVVVAIERVERHQQLAGQQPRLVRVVLRDECAATALRAALSRRISTANSASDEFHNLKTAGAFIHADLSPPQLAFQRRLRDFCREKNAQPDKHYRYFYRDTTLMRVPFVQKT